jgi:hypothetical protein
MKADASVGSSGVKVALVFPVAPAVAESAVVASVVAASAGMAGLVASVAGCSAGDVCAPAYPIEPAAMSAASALLAIRLRIVI